MLLITTYGVAVSTFRTLWCARNEAGHRLRLAQLRDAHALEYWLVWMFTLPACVSPLFRPLFFFRLCARVMLTGHWGVQILFIWDAKNSGECLRFLSYRLEVWMEADAPSPPL